MDNLSIRLKHLGGKKQEDRMQLDKLRTLKKALIYSYQGATAVLEDGREFRCLINPDKLKNDYDNKIISIPFYDICLMLFLNQYFLPLHKNQSFFVLETFLHHVQLRNYQIQVLTLPLTFSHTH